MRIKVQGTISAQPLAHVMHCQYAGPSPTSADCVSLAASFRAIWLARVAPIVAPTVSYNYFEFADLASATGGVGANSVAVVGTHGQIAAPPLSACVVVSWRVGYRFRGGHSRTYLPIADNQDISLGRTLGAVYKGLVLTNMTNFLTDVNALTYGTGDVALAMLSYYRNNALRPTPIPFLISQPSVHNRIDSQRRRLGKESG